MWWLHEIFDTRCYAYVWPMPSCSVYLSIYRVTTCLENLEISGNLTAVREMIGILLKCNEMSGKTFVRKSGLNCSLLAAYLCPFLTLLKSCISYWFQIVAFLITVAFLPRPLTYTSTDMIWVTLDMGGSAMNHQRNVGKFHIVWRVVTPYLSVRPSRSYILLKWINISSKCFHRRLPKLL